MTSRSGWTRKYTKVGGWRQKGKATAMATDSSPDRAQRKREEIPLVAQGDKRRTGRREAVASNRRNPLFEKQGRAPSSSDEVSGSILLTESARRDKILDAASMDAECCVIFSGRRL